LSDVLPVYSPWSMTDIPLMWPFLHSVDDTVAVPSPILVWCFSAWCLSSCSYIFRLVMQSTVTFLCACSLHIVLLHYNTYKYKTCGCALFPLAGYCNPSVNVWLCEATETCVRPGCL
jgi:hypothetical protein